MTFPSIIQGGTGIGVSGWQLAHAVSSRGQLGVVSGGDLRRAMRAFPLPGVAADALRRYFRAGGREAAPYRMLPMYRKGVSLARALWRLSVFASSARMT
jgi:hypothetical protein